MGDSTQDEESRLRSNFSARSASAASVASPGKKSASRRGAEEASKTSRTKGKPHSHGDCASGKLHRLLGRHELLGHREPKVLPTWLVRQIEKATDACSTGSEAGSVTGKTRTSAVGSVAGKSTARSKTGEGGDEGDDEEEEEEEELELEFDFVACGYSHTMLVTKNGGLLMACGNHRYGQLGIAEKHKEDDARNCQECALL
eukprot:1412733-Rhodomonas_salina.1